MRAKTLCEYHKLMCSLTSKHADTAFAAKVEADLDISTLRQMPSLLYQSGNEKNIQENATDQTATCVEKEAITEMGVKMGKKEKRNGLLIRKTRTKSTNRTKRKGKERRRWERGQREGSERKNM